MAQRDRSQSSTIDGGIRWQSGSPIPSVQIINSTGSFTDFTDPGDCRPLSGSTWKFSGGIVNHPLDTAGTGFQSYVCDMLRSTVAGPHIGNPDGIPGDVSAATSAAARTNPSRPYVDLPVDLLQIGESFSFIKTTGDSLFKLFAKGHIRFAFDINPNISDLVKLMFHFHDQVDRRVRDVKRLQTTKGLRKTVSVGMGSLASDVLWTQQSNGIFLSTRARGNTVREKRVHCRWTPTTDLSKIGTPAEMRRLIARAMLGLTVDLSTIWQLIPWSWLIDWGSSLGNFLKANRNIIPASLTTCVVMTHTRTEWSAPGLSGTKNGQKYSLEPIQIIRESKSRTSVSPSVTAQFPFLDGNQVGLLSSLFAMKANFGPIRMR